MKLSHDEIITKLERLGLKFKRLTLWTEGRYTPEDAIWNYKDGIVHIRYIHPLGENVPILNHENSLASVFVQRAFGIDFPLVLFDYEEAPFTQTAVTCIFGFILVIFNHCEEVRPGITRVTTTYNIGARPFMSWLAPFGRMGSKAELQGASLHGYPAARASGRVAVLGYEFKTSDYASTEA